MFLSKARAGYLGTEQYASGLFLMLFCNENAPKLANGRAPIRALVRKIALRQCGHFMMGRVTLRGVRFSLSGSYGHDGLPIEITEYKRIGVPEKPETFETVEQHRAYYDALDACEWKHVERAPGLWERLHPLPDELVERFWTSNDGHNSHGSEGASIFTWAVQNIETLKHLKGAK